MTDRLPIPLAQQLRAAAFTYDDVGRTQSQRIPRGYRGLQRSRDIGTGGQRFEQAVDALLSWGTHRRAGIGVRASSDDVGPGGVAVLRLGVGVLGVDAPVRVTYVVDEPNRKGFAYGTLPGHPESGEEAFIVSLRADEVVTFTITAFSRPATPLARLAGPLARGVQAWVADRYLRAL